MRLASATSKVFVLHKGCSRVESEQSRFIVHVTTTTTTVYGRVIKSSSICLEVQTIARGANEEAPSSTSN